MKRMKNTVKSLAALLMSFVMVLACSSIVMAAEPVPAKEALAGSTTGSITITGLTQGDVVYMNKIVSVTYNDTNNALSFAFASSAITQMMQKAGVADVAAWQNLTGSDQAFKNVMQQIMLDKSQLQEIHQTVGADGSVTFPNLGMGQYAVKVSSSSGRIYNPITAELLPVLKVNGTPETDEAGHYMLENKTINISNTKYSDPQIKKTVSSTSASYGDTLKYSVVIDVPKYSVEYTDVTMKVTDTLSEGLKFAESISVEVYADNAATKLDGGAFTPSVDPTGKVMTVEFKYDQVEGYEKLKLEYAAVVTSDASLGSSLKNTAKYEYTVSAYGTNEKEDETESSTYGLRIDKVDANNDQMLGGVEFKLKDANGQLVKFHVEEQTGNLGNGLGNVTYKKYVVDPNGNVDTIVTETQGATMGRASVWGLAEGKYTLTETKAKTGYELPTNPDFQVEISGSMANERGFVVYKLENTKGVYLLPSTGGDGVWFFIVGGICLMGAAVAMLVIAKKKGKENIA